MKKHPYSRNSFPQKLHVSGYIQEYSHGVQSALNEVPVNAIEKALLTLQRGMKKGAHIYVGGNGGSSAIASHLCCDFITASHLPGKQNGLKVHSLNEVPLFTAFANDYGYKHSLSKQIQMMSGQGDILILISSSGNSPNIVKAALKAKRLGLTVIGLTGFNGGRLRNIADVSLHVPLQNYGMIEDSHQMLMHVLAQILYLRRRKERKHRASLGKSLPIDQGDTKSRTELIT